MSDPLNLAQVTGEAILLRGRVDDMRAWARSRIEHCQREEAKFAARTTSIKSSVMIEAVTERRALQAVLAMLKGPRD